MNTTTRNFYKQDVLVLTLKSKACCAKRSSFSLPLRNVQPKQGYADSLIYTEITFKYFTNQLKEVNESYLGFRI